MGQLLTPPKGSASFISRCHFTLYFINMAVQLLSHQLSFPSDQFPIRSVSGGRGCGFPFHPGCCSSRGHAQRLIDVCAATGGPHVVRRGREEERHVGRRRGAVASGRGRRPSAATAPRRRRPTTTPSWPLRRASRACQTRRPKAGERSCLALSRADSGLHMECVHYLLLYGKKMIFPQHRQHNTFS